MRHPRHFSPPFYSRPLPSPPPPSPVRRRGRRRSLLRPLSRPAAALRRRCGRVDGASNSPCGPTRPGKSSCKYVRNCRLCLCKHILLPRPDAPMEIGTSEFDTANFHTRKEILSLLRQRVFHPLRSDCRPIPKNRGAKVSNVD